LEGHAENFTGSADGEILLHTKPAALLHKHDLLEEGIPLAVGDSVGLSPLLFFILAGKSKFEERRKRGKNYQKTDGPWTDDTTISTSTNKMKLPYIPGFKNQLMFQDVTG